MFYKVILETDETLKFITDSFKNWNVCNKAVDNHVYVLEFVRGCFKAQKCVINMLILILLQYNFFLNTIKLKKGVTKMLILALYWFCSWSIRLNKCVIKVFLKIILCENIDLIDIRSRKCVLKLGDAVFCNEDEVFVNEDSGNVTFLVMIWVFSV